MQQPEVLPSFFSKHWGDIVNVVGLIISIVGFIITIVNVKRSKSAAERAEKAVKDVRNTILRSDTIMELSAAVTTMEEIKRLHRVNAWAVLPDRYSSLKRILVSIRGANFNLSQDHRVALQSAIQHFSDIEKKVERALAAQHSPPNAAILNEVVSSQVDKISEVLATIRQDLGN